MSENWWIVAVIISVSLVENLSSPNDAAEIESENDESMSEDRYDRTRTKIEQLLEEAKRAARDGEPHQKNETEVFVKSLKDMMPELRTCLKGLALEMPGENGTEKMIADGLDRLEDLKLNLEKLIQE